MSNTVKLTKHQAAVLDRLTRISGVRGDWIEASIVGSKQGLVHLLEKGYVVVDEQSGPRGGVRKFYRPAKFGESRRTVHELEIPAVLLGYFLGEDLTIDQTYTSVGWEDIGAMGLRPTRKALRILQGTGVTSVAVRGRRPGDRQARLADFTVRELLA